MGEADFDTDSLADYLHLLPQQVRRMVERGKLPGRKVGGQWRFSRAEIHHWLEARIGALGDDDELAKMESVLQRGSTPETTGSVEDLLHRSAIAVPLAAKTRVSVIDRIVDLAAQTGLLWDAPKMAAAVRVREEMYPTAIPGGVALLHPRRPMSGILSEPLLAVGRTTQGVPFGGPDGQLTDVFFLICSMDDQGHLRTLARLSRLIKDPDVLPAIRAAADADEVYRTLVDREAQF